MVVKVKEYFEKTRQIENNNRSKKYTFRGQRDARYHDTILSDTKNQPNSIFFLIQQILITSRLVVYK